MPAIERYLSRPLAEDAHAWCECGWTDKGPWSHKTAFEHGNRYGHVTHVHESDNRTTDRYQA